MTDNRFVFVAPMFNASKTLARMLHSVCGQSYTRWKLILIDDVSDLHHASLQQKIIDSFLTTNNTYDINVIWNGSKMWEVANVLHGISLCNDDDIICRIDADDALCDLDALAIMNETYVATGCDVAWSNHRWGLSDKNISGSMVQGVDVYRHPWCASHLKTFKKALINEVNDENFLGKDGQYIKRAGDQAIFLPVLHKSKKWVHVPRALYSYTIDDVPETYETDDAKFQQEEALFLRARGYVQ